MIPSRQLRRLLLLAAAILSSVGHTHSTSFGFPDCVGQCVSDAGCSTSSARCICFSARGNLLINVVGCMYKSCQNRLVSADSDFLDHVTSVCESRNIPVPPDKVATAEAVAASLVGLLPPFSTTNPVQSATATKGQSPPRPTSTAASTTSPQQTSASASSTSDTDTFVATTTVTPPLSPTEPPSTTQGPGSQPPQQNGPPPDPTDSSPFATPNAAPQDAAFAWIGAAGVPLLAMWGLI